MTNIILPNSDGKKFREAGNRARIALASHFAARNEPSTAWLGMLWHDEGREELKYCVGTAPRRWLTLLKNVGNNWVFTLQRTATVLPFPLGDQIAKNDTRTTPAIFSVRDVVIATRNESLIPGGVYGIHVGANAPLLPVEGWMWYETSSSRVLIYSEGSWVEWIRVSAASPFVSLSFDGEGFEQGDFTLFQVGTDTKERTWSASALSRGIASVQQSPAPLATVNELVLGSEGRVRGITPSAFAAAIRSIYRSLGGPTSSPSLTLSDLQMQTETLKTVTGANLKNALTDTSLALTDAELQNKNSTKWGIVDKGTVDRAITAYVNSDTLSTLDSISRLSEVTESGVTYVHRTAAWCSSSAVLFGESKRNKSDSAFSKFASSLSVDPKKGVEAKNTGTLERISPLFRVLAAVPSWPESGPRRPSGNTSASAMFNIDRREFFTGKPRGAVYYFSLPIQGTEGLRVTWQDTPWRYSWSVHPSGNATAGWILDHSDGKDRQKRIGVTSPTSGLVTGFFVGVNHLAGQNYYPGFVVFRQVATP